MHAALAAHGIAVPLARLAADPVFTAAQLRRRLRIGQDALPDGSFVQAARAYWFAHTDRIRPIPTAEAAARTAAEHAGVAVVSANYADIVRHGLSVIRLDDLPWTVVGREDVPRTKPAPDPYLHAAALLGVHPGAWLAHEDTDEGVLAAGAAGMDVIDVRHRPWR